MRTWARSAIARRCGGPCDKPIAVGDPVLFIKLPQVAQPRIRCARCAGEQPPDLPPLDVSKPPPKSAPLPTMKRLGMLPLDERQPGEEG